MDLDIPNIIGVRLKILNFLHGIVIVNPQSHIIARGDEPLLAGDKLGTSHGEFGHLKRLDVRSGLVIPNGDIARVEGGEGP